MTRGVVCHQNFVRCAQRLAIGPDRADHDADPSDHDGDLGDHDGDPGDHDAPILAITMGRSERSRWAEIRTYVGYIAGGALLAGAAVTAIVLWPRSKEHAAKAPSRSVGADAVAPIVGGGTYGAGLVGHF